MIKHKRISSVSDENMSQEQSISKLKRTFVFFMGVLSLTLAIIGILIPILPTTPFLLISATCFFKSSKKAYNWLLNNKIFGDFIQNYQEGKGISSKHKKITISILWITIILSIVIIKTLWVSILLPIIAIAVSAHISLLKPKSPKKEGFDTEGFDSE